MMPNGWPTTRTIRPRSSPFSDLWGYAIFRRAIGLLRAMTQTRRTRLARVNDLLDPASAYVYAIPLRTRFRGITVREGMLIEGPLGWGEFCPFAEYDDR